MWRNVALKRTEELRIIYIYGLYGLYVYIWFICVYMVYMCIYIHMVLICMGYFNCDQKMTGIFMKFMGNFNGKIP
jgi:hypothetical protein